MTAAAVAPLTPEDQQRAYLEALFRGLGGYIDVRTITPDGSVVRRTFSGVPAVERFLSNGVTDGSNVYVGTATRISNSVAVGAGDKSQLHTGRVVFVDVDYKKEGDAEALATALKTFPFPPSMRVGSGGGEHVYWLLEEPFDLSLAVNRTHFEHVLKGLADVLHADRSATDCSRILRVPGTINYPDAKKRAKGRTEAPAVLLECDTDRVYHLDDFASFEQRGQALTTEKNFTAYAQPDAVDPGALPEWVEALLKKEHGRLWKRWNGVTDGLEDTSASGLDMAIANLLALERADGSGIEQALRSRRATAGADPKHPTYYQKTVGLALNWAAKQRNAEPALNHDGDIAAAARALAARGFGKQQARVPGPHGERREEQPDWPERRPIPDVHDPVPTLDEALIPEPLRAWVVDIAQRLCVPLSFIAAPAVVATSSVVGRKVGMLPKRNDDWTVISNLWGAVVANTGELKSQAINQAFAPVRRLAIAATDQFKLDESRGEAQQAILEAKISALKRRAKADSATDKEVGDIQFQLAELMREQKDCVAYERRYTTQDATVEKLGELLIQNPRGMTLLRDELSGWARTLDKPGREGDREFYLEAWNGDGRYSVDRIGRGTIHIPSLTLSIFGGIQPGKLQTYVDDALDHRQGDDGLIQRIQVLVWPDSIQKWENIDRWPKAEAREAAFRIYKGLDDLDPEILGASPIHDGGIPALRFSEEAQGLFDDWRDDLEHRLRGEDLRQSPSFGGHLAKYRSLMPSFALLFHLIEAVNRGTRGPVSLGNARLAAAWCEFLEAHARKLYGAELRPGAPAARRIAARIQRGNIRDGMTVYEIARCKWSGLSKTQTVNAGLEVLEASGWVKCSYTESGQTGGRPAHLVRLHPDLLGESHG